MGMFGPTLMVIIVMVIMMVIVKVMVMVMVSKALSQVDWVHQPQFQSII